MIPVVLAMLVATPARHGAAPCTRVTRAGIELRQDTRICPGRYRVADPDGHGVLVISVSSIRLDLRGVIIESGDSIPAHYSGIGIAAKGVDSIAIIGGTIRGFRYGVRLEAGAGHSISGMTLSGSRTQALASTPSHYAQSDWLDIFRPDIFETYGAGLYLKGVQGASVTNVVARDAQNGIMLSSVRLSQFTDNDVSDNTGWGFSLWRSSRNVLVRNRAHHNVRCESETYSLGCDSAALLVRQHSDSNLIAENDLGWSGDGLFLSGHQPGLEGSVGNLVVRNDASHAYHNAFEATWSWGTVFLDNRADSAAYGFWLGYSSGLTVRGNTVVGSKETGIAIEHGSDNEIAANVIIGGKDGIHLFAPTEGMSESRGYRVDDNVLAKLGRGVVLERTSDVRLRGNVFDGDGEGLVADSAARSAVVVGNILLRPGTVYIRAPELDAGGNYWGSASIDETKAKLAGNITLEPWKTASAAGY